jgi:co-chaperonin GroES (HSP10)
MTWKTPALADCAPSIEPSRYGVLLAMSEKQTQTAGGVLLAPETLEREEFGATQGRIIALAPLVFTFAKPEEWGSARKPQVGDVVLVDKFSGVKVKGADDRDYRLVSDVDILAVTERVPARRPLSITDIYPTEPLEQANG